MSDPSGLMSAASHRSAVAPPPSSHGSSGGGTATTAAATVPPPPSLLRLTAATAPGAVFESRSDLAAHYQSDWHRYNLKRRESGLPVLLQSDFEARRDAALALQREAEQANTKANHKKNRRLRKEARKSGGAQAAASLSSSARQWKQQQQEGPSGQNEITEDSAIEAVATTAMETAADPVVQLQQATTRPTNPPLIIPSAEGTGTWTAASDGPEAVNADGDDKAAETADENPQHHVVEIDPRRCLFDSHVSPTVEANVKWMNVKYGFFVPDSEYLVDMEGLVGYCHEVIQLGHICLWCHKAFASGRDCQKHMIDKNHTKLLYQAGHDLEDLTVFYDFATADDEFLRGLRKGGGTKVQDDTDEQSDKMPIDSNDENDDEEEDGWEDVSSDGDNENEGVSEGDYDDEDGDILHLYEQEVERMGLDVTPLGELVFPDGRIVGHRTFRRYYKQRLSSHRQPTSVAVAAARLAASERLYRGRVYRLPSSSSMSAGHGGGGGALASGRTGGGLLVPWNRSGGGLAACGEFRQLSVYRFRAAVRKERYGEQYGKRLRERANLNMNRMDKKANRLMNGVSVAHAAR